MVSILVAHFFATYLNTDVLQIGRLRRGFSCGEENAVFVEDLNELVRVRFGLVFIRVRDVCLWVLVWTRLLFAIDLSLSSTLIILQSVTAIPELIDRLYLDLWGSVQIVEADLRRVLNFNTLRGAYQVREGLPVLFQSLRRPPHEMLAIGKLKCGLVVHLNVTKLRLV